MIDWDEIEAEDEINPGLVATVEALAEVNCAVCKGAGCMDCFETGSEAERQFGG